MDFVIGTWSFCYDAIKQGEEIFRSQTNCIDTIEKTINCAYIKLFALQITTMQESTFTLHGRYFHFRITSQGQKNPLLIGFHLNKLLTHQICIVSRQKKKTTKDPWEERYIGNKPIWVLASLQITTNVCTNRQGCEWSSPLKFCGPAEKSHPC